MMYAFSENFILPISHDEVVHGKQSLISKMFGDYNQKFDGLKTYLAFMYAHPGKKLLFMGCEIAQFDEWNYNAGIQFNLLFFEKHGQTQKFVRELNHFYLTHPPMYEIDYNWHGFKWHVVDDKSANVLAFSRFDKSGDEIICVFNFSLAERKGYKIPLNAGLYEEVFATRPIKNGKIKTISTAQGAVLPIDLAPQSAIFLKKGLNSCTV